MNNNPEYFDLRCGRFSLKLGNRTHIMGILNVTPNSFYDGGFYHTLDNAVAHAEKMAEEGADIIDIGGESTRPGSEPLSAEEELKRILPVVKLLAKRLEIPLSVDTYKSEVARRVLEEGTDMINDISGFRFDNRMIEVLAHFEDIPVVVMHTYDRPKTMQDNPVYLSLIEDIKGSLAESMHRGIEGGIKRERFIIDPGIGFGKTVDDNLTIIKRLSEFKELERPILIGTSRKRFIQKTLDLPVKESLEGTLATVTASILNGADMVRVHDVKESRRAAAMADAIKNISAEKRDQAHIQG